MVVNKKHISIVIPAYNEEDVISKLAKRLVKVMNAQNKFLFEVIIVENGSRDNTFEELIKIRKGDSRFKILQLAKNEGADGGIIAGLNYATGDAAIIMMADLQEPPELIPTMLKNWQRGYDIVYGIVKKRLNFPLHRKIGTYIFYRLMTLLTNGNLPENVSDFRILDRKVYEVLAVMPEHNKFFRGLAMWSGFTRTGVVFERPERAGGQSKADIRTTFTVAVNGIVAFSTLPLRLPWLLFIIVLIVGIVSTVLLSLQTGLIILIISLLFFINAVQAEYILRIFIETRNRPNFIVKNVFGLKKVMR